MSSNSGRQQKISYVRFVKLFLLRKRLITLPEKSEELGKVGVALWQDGKKSKRNVGQNVILLVVLPFLSTYVEKQRIFTKRVCIGIFSERYKYLFRADGKTNSV